MASFKSPSEFASSSAANYPVKLLPPSCFESCTKADPWKELANATSEILTLKQQNEQLRDCKKLQVTAKEEIKNDGMFQATPQTQILHTNQFDGIINRQAAELAEVRQRLQNTESQYQRQVARLESQVLLKDAESKQEVISLQKEHQRLQQEYQTEIKKLKEDHMRTAEEETSKRSKLDSRLKSQTVSSEDTISGLTQQLKSLHEKYNHYQTESQQKISDCEDNMRTYKQQLEQHKTYISESEEATKSTQLWKNQIETLNNNVQILKSEKNNLESSLQLVNIRLKSQNDIHIIQDQQLSQVKDTSSERKRAVLLTRWREKVFELMVQLESAHITQKDLERNYLYKVSDLENELEAQRNTCEILEHRMVDMQAQIDLEKNTVKTLESELTSAQEMAIHLDDKNKQFQVTIHSLVDYANGMYEKYCANEKSLIEVQSQLDAYTKRITFASGRVEMLQSQFARKEALLKMELEEKYQEKPTKDTVNFLEEENQSMISQLSSELEKVQKERDHLAAQIKKDASSLEDKIKNARQQVADEVEQLRNRANELHGVLDDQNEKLKNLEESYNTSQCENEEYRNTIEELQTELGKIQVQHEKEMEVSKAEEGKIVVEQLAEMEHRLNDARREHTKAVVSLRQLERQSEREKQRLKDEGNRMEEKYKEIITKLQHNLKSSETDRNLLMTTLRQEGLIGKYKDQRQKPITLQDTEFTGETDQDTTELESERELPGSSKPIHLEMSKDIPGFPLTSSRDTFFEDSGEQDNVPTQSGDVDPAVVLEELKHLSEELLDDTDDSVSDS